MDTNQSTLFEPLENEVEIKQDVSFKLEKQTMAQSLIETAALSVIQKESTINGRQTAVDPATVLSFVQMIMDLIQRCREAKESAAEHVAKLQEVAANPGILVRLAVGRAVDKQSDGTFTLRMRRNRAKALLDSCVEAKVQDLTALIQESDSL